MAPPSIGTVYMGAAGRDMGLHGSFDIWGVGCGFAAVEWLCKQLTAGEWVSRIFMVYALCAFRRDQEMGW